MQNHFIEKLVSRTLQVGVLASALLLVIGIVGLFLHPPSLTMILTTPNLSEFFTTVISSPSSYPLPVLLLNAGLLVLILTPFARIVIILFGFAAQNDWSYVVYSFIVLLIIIVSMSLDIG